MRAALSLALLAIAVLASPAQALPELAPMCIPEQALACHVGHLACPEPGTNQLGACAELDPEPESMGYQAAVAVGDAGGLRVGAAGLVGTGVLGAASCAEAHLAPGGPGAAVLVDVPDADDDLAPEPWVEAGLFRGAPPC